jgi:hypothetical protein
MKPTAWYDPSNGVVSIDRDCPLFTPLGQVWPLSLEREWVGLTDEEIDAVWVTVAWRSSKGLQELRREYARAIEAAHGIKENT